MGEWIRAIDQMPDQGQRVLVFCQEVEEATYWKHEPGVHEGDSGFCDMLDNEIFPVTHWMPLPAPPSTPC